MLTFDKNGFAFMFIAVDYNGYTLNGKKTIATTICMNNYKILSKHYIMLCIFELIKWRIMILINNSKPHDRHIYPWWNLNASTCMWTNKTINISYNC